MSGSLQPMVELVSQQSCPPQGPQSTAHRAQSSPPVHAPSPQTSGPHSPGKNASQKSQTSSQQSPLGKQVASHQQLPSLADPPQAPSQLGVPQGPQSVSHEAHVSSASHVPSPQTGPGPSQVLPQSSWPSVTQVASQDVEQHQSSKAQTQSRMARSVHPGSSEAVQQSPPPQGPQSAAQLAQSSPTLQVPSPQNGPVPQSAGKSASQ